jgi:hypothetical protein
VVILRVSYRVRLHQLRAFEEAFRVRMLPVIREHQLRFRGLARSLVGNAGEYLELWEFDSLAHFEAAWGEFQADPRFIDVYETTGPLVEDENYALFEPITL